MCNKTIQLGDGIFAVSLDFEFIRQYGEHRCFTNFVIPDSYLVSYKFLGKFISRDNCNTSLTIKSVDKSYNYQFCLRYEFPSSSVVLENSQNLMFDFRSVDSYGYYNMLLYIFQTGRTCNRAEGVRCRNGRCIDHDLYCNPDFNFCDDDTVTGACTDDNRDLKDDFSYNNMSIIGPICLGLFGFLVILFVMYFCFKSKRIRQLLRIPDNSTRRSRPLTARDVYIINVGDTGGTPEEGYDYVIDYKKFSAPPEYSSLEDIAEASARYTNNNDNTECACSHNDLVDGATGGGHTNEGFVTHDDDELPKYEHVMTNAEDFKVNHNHL